MAKEHVHGYQLSKANVFAINMFDDIDKYAKVSDQYAPPPTKEFKSHVSEKPAASLTPSAE